MAKSPFQKLKPLYLLKYLMQHSDEEHPVSTAELIAELARNGINIIRLGVTWEGIEPKMDEYNTVYLDGVKNTLDICEKYGVYAFIDWHQDLFSCHNLTSGDGAPKWACARSLDKPHDPYLIWAEGYFADPGIHKCFDAFWNNEPVCGRGIQDRYCDMIAYTVKYLSFKFFCT